MERDGEVGSCWLFILNIKILWFLSRKTDSFLLIFFPVYLSFCSRSILPPRDTGLNWAILSESSRDSNQFEFWHLEIDGRENNIGKKFRQWWNSMCEANYSENSLCTSKGESFTLSHRKQMCFIDNNNISCRKSTFISRIFSYMATFFS